MPSSFDFRRVVEGARPSTSNHAYRKSRAPALRPVAALAWRKKTTRRLSSTGCFMVPAITYFRTFQHYHRPEKLNDRVRNGNVCFLLGKVTGERAERRRPAHPSWCMKKVAVKRNCNRLFDVDSISRPLILIERPAKRTLMWSLATRLQALKLSTRL